MKLRRLVIRPVYIRNGKLLDVFLDHLSYKMYNESKNLPESMHSLRFLILLGSGLALLKSYDSDKKILFCPVMAFSHYARVCKDEEALDFVDNDIKESEIELNFAYFLSGAFYEIGKISLLKYRLFF